MRTSDLDPRIWTPRRLDRLYRISERNEAWAELCEWGEKVDLARRRGYPLPVSGGLYKDRWALSQGDLAGTGGTSSWDVDTLPVADFGVNTSVAQNAFVRTGFNIFPLVNPFTALGSPDAEPFQDPGGTLTAAVGDRQVGSGRQALVCCAGVFIVHSTGGGAVYQPPATATINVRVQNCVTTVTGGLTTEATLNITTAANFIDQAPITATTGRGLTRDTGVALTNVFLLFNGDFVVGELNNTNAATLNVQGNILFAMLELV